MGASLATLQGQCVMALWAAALCHNPSLVRVQLALALWAVALRCNPSLVAQLAQRMDSHCWVRPWGNRQLDNRHCRNRLCGSHHRCKHRWGGHWWGSRCWGTCHVGSRLSHNRRSCTHPQDSRQLGSRYLGSCPSGNGAPRNTPAGNQMAKPNPARRADTGAKVRKGHRKDSRDPACTETGLVACGPRPSWPWPGQTRHG